MAKKPVSMSCPTCKHILDCASGPGIPKPGDLSVCVYCQTVLQFKKNMSYRIFTKLELEELPDENKREIQQAIIFFRAVSERTH